MNVVHIVGNGFDIEAGLGTEAETLIQEFCRVVRLAKSAPKPALYLASDIHVKGFEYWSDFESALGRYSANESVANNPGAYWAAKAEFDNVLRECLCARVKLVDEPFVEANAKVCMDSLKNMFTALEMGERARRRKIQGNLTNSHAHHIVTLNYTPTLEKLCEKVGFGATISSSSAGVHTLADFFYAHSSLEQMPVCGVDSAEQILNKAFRDDKNIIATVVKSAIQQGSGKVEDEPVFRLIGNADAICVHGCSFGETDGRWWRAINERMVACGHVVLVISSHRYTGDYHVPAYQRVAREGAMNKFFNAIGAEEDLRDSLADRVFVVPSSKLFTISSPLAFKTLPEKTLQEIADRLYPPEG